MKRVNQQSWETADCGIACVAMVSDKEYQETFTLLSKYGKDGTFYTRHHHLIKAIKDFGKEAFKRKFKSYDAIHTRAIIAVNEDEYGNWHWIAFNGEPFKKYAYDPNPKNPSKLSIDILEIDYIPKANSFYIEILNRNT